LPEPVSIERALPVPGRRRQAFERLVLQHQDQIYSLALRLLGDREAAEDVAQEAFCRALQGLRGFRKEASFYTWLSKITVNLCRSEQRRNRVRKSTRLFSWLGRRGRPDASGEPPVPSRQPLPEDVVTGEERHDAVRQAVASLERDLRQVVVLRDIEGYSYEDVAHLLDIPIGTVRSRLHRARGLLRERLSPWIED
jgi:RNA polymerase sigma-70 factor (ECF subfamily)